MLWLLACAPSAPETAREGMVSAQRVRVGEDSSGAPMLSLHVLVTDETGAAVPCGTGDLTVQVEVSDSSASGPWTTLTETGVDIRCRDAGGGDLAVVVDNSGSEDGFLEHLQAGARNMLDGVVGAGGRSSLVRVSTNSSIVQPLTDDAAALDAAVDTLHIGNGWTALWDGVRIGNETLGAAAADTDGLDSFCDAAGRLGVVTFTDGVDNNSSDEQDYDHEAFPGDGINTTLDDVENLRSGNATTPMYTIGLGDAVDDAALDEIATTTGGRYLGVDSEEDIEGVFDLVTDYFGATTQVCTALPEAECGRMWVRVTTTWSDGGAEVTSTTTTSATLDCDAPATGRTAVLLLTLTNPGIPTATAGSLAANAIDFTSPTVDPSVLVILDDNHHDEFRDDAAWIATTLEGRGYSVSYLEEPGDGLSGADLAGYDVVWLSNPGYPMDDRSTVNALSSFSAGGGGLVLQGDDMAWSWGLDFTMTPLTHLDFSSNGTDYCGRWTDNNAGSSYSVRIGEDNHTLIAGLEGQTFSYGDDIDTTTARDEGETVLAWATVDDCGEVPVIVAYEP